MYDCLGTKREAKISWDKVIDIHLFHQIIKNTIVQKLGSLPFESTNEISMQSLDFFNVICRA